MATPGILTRSRALRVFAVLNLCQAALIGSLPLVASSREPLVNGVLFFAAALMALAGLALLFAGTTGRRIAIVFCAIHGFVGTVFSMLIMGSASYLYGIYGRHGHAVGTIAFVLVVVVFIVFWLLPAHEIWFLRQRREEKPS